MKKNFFLVLVLAFAISSCAHKMNFNNSSTVPGAEGDVKYKKDKNNNYQLEIEVVNLAAAKDLTPSRDTYVVWIETDDDGAKNVGQINPSSNLLSKARKGELKTTTTAKPKRVFITAENDGNTQYPSGEVVLSTRD